MPASRPVYSSLTWVINIALVLDLLIASVFICNKAGSGVGLWIAPQPVRGYPMWPQYAYPLLLVGVQDSSDSYNDDIIVMI